MTQEELWFWLCNIPDIWQHQIKGLMARFASPDEIFKASEEELINAHCLTVKEIKNIIKAQREYENIINELKCIKKNNINFIYKGHSEYPEAFKKMDDAPYSFYYKGRLPDKDKYSVGMVGARICSEYGRSVANKTAHIFAANDIQVISGMAAGIDAYSSRGAIEGGGQTFVVLGTGIDIIYPKENIELYYDILMNGGGIISEYPVGTPGRPWQFPHRNRLISSLSDKLMIIEAKLRSGTLTTAAHALSQNVEIYAVPGRLNDRLSEGCNRLIADGCGIYINSERFLQDLYERPPKCMNEEALSDFNDIKNIYNRKKKAKQRNDEDDSIKGRCSPDEMKIYNIIGYEAISADEIIEKSKMDAEYVSAAISSLLLSGIINEISQDIFIRS